MKTAEMIQYYQTYLSQCLPKWHISREAAMTQLTELMPGSAVLPDPTERQSAKDQQNKRLTPSSR